MGHKGHYAEDTAGAGVGANVLFGGIDLFTGVGSTCISLRFPAPHAVDILFRVKLPGPGKRNDFPQRRSQAAQASLEVFMLPMWS